MTIKLDVLLVQLIHIAILFWVFKKLIGNTLVDALLSRKAQIAKLENADLEYQQAIADAKDAADQLIREGMNRKEELITEGSLLAQKRADDIIAQATHTATKIEDEAKTQAARLEQELKQGFVDGVKQTAELVVNKLLKNDVKLQETYVSELVKEFSK